MARGASPGTTDATDGENPPLGKQRLDPSGIWYTPSSGIWQTVWMEPVAPDHVDSLKLTPDVSAGRLTVEAQGVRDGVRDVLEVGHVAQPMRRTLEPS